MGRQKIVVVLGGCLALVAACTSANRGTGSSSGAATTPMTSVPSSGRSATPSSVPATSQTITHSAIPLHSPSPAHSTAPTHPAGGRLPLSFPVGSATEVITALASSTSSTQGTLQTWQKTDTGWVRVGPAVRAWFGSDGLSSHPSESKSATPIGSFTLTEAFGHDPNPGTSLPYRHTTSADWWISQAGPLYNTEQHCSADCGFRQGSPNEHLYYETPYYDYAVVIDYNRFPVHQGAGSAFFLHVTVGAPTAGCISIDKSDLVRILRWLKPADHPRILIGLA